MTDVVMTDVADVECRPITSHHQFQTRLHNCLAILCDASLDSPPSPETNLTIFDISKALLLPGVKPLQLYRAAACLREGDVRQLVQILVFAGPTALLPALRLLNVMRGLPGNRELVIELLEEQHPNNLLSLEQRAVTLIALLAGESAYHLCDLAPLLRSAVPDPHGEAALAMHIALQKRWSGPVETVFHISNWDTEVPYADSPSFWRELKWALYARYQCVAVSKAEESAQLTAQENTKFCTDKLDSLFEPLPAEFGLASQHHIMIDDIMMRLRSITGSRVGEAQGDEHRSADLRKCPGSKHEAMVVTDGVCRVLWTLAKSLCYGRPVLLEGETGCGKTSIISLLARQTAYGRSFHESAAPGVTFVQMDSAMSASDGDTISSLLGGIVPLPQGGGFRWRPGPIGAAVEKGGWLVFENLGKASLRLSSAIALISDLARLRPGDKLRAPGRGEPLTIGKGFRCIATRTVFESGEDRSWEPPGGWRNWERITMKTLSSAEQCQILDQRFPTISDCVARVIRAVTAVANFVDSHRSPLSRKPTLREAVRLCNRLKALRSEAVELLTAENALLESIDVLAAWCPAGEHRDVLLNHLASVWSLSSGIASDMLANHKPLLTYQGSIVRVGRASMHRLLTVPSVHDSDLTLTGHTLRLLERLTRSLQVGEHVLLSGESGSGKTAIVQHIAKVLGKKLVVVNLSRQSELSDLVGGFRPIELAAAIPLLARKFEKAFCKSMSRTKNLNFLDALQVASRSVSDHPRAIRLMEGAFEAIPRKAKEIDEESNRMWSDVVAELRKLSLALCPSPTVIAVEQVDSSSGRSSSSGEPARKRRKASPPSTEQQNLSSVSRKRPRSGQKRRKVDFQFVDGVMVQAMREGYWLLLDEVNLAPAELLERLVSVVDRGQLLLPNENGDVLTCVKGFRLFGAMNPPTDVGKRPLPGILRTRFTEIFCGDMSDMEDIKFLVIHRLFGERRSIEDLRGSPGAEHLLAERVAQFCVECCVLGKQGRIEDPSGRPARFSLRTLTRMLDYGSGVKRYMKLGLDHSRRALYEGAILAFATPLSKESQPLVSELAARLILTGSKTDRTRQMTDQVVLPEHMKETVQFVEGFPIATSFYVVDKTSSTNTFSSNEMRFVISPSVKRTLQDVCRALVLGAPRLPILLQGPTAAGKTALVRYLADITGNHLTRINNHEHTDITEYLGGYVTTPDGALVYREGPLVSAAREGTWILLDELNLAPPEVLESLNRLLDDNREVLISETGEVVKAAEEFRVFATQNPPGLYGGRKELSRAFRSRFVEIQVADLSDEDLLTILEDRCQLPTSFVKKMITVMRELQIRRKTTNLFSGRDGFVTARDLFRWASRGPRSKEELALHGFFLFGERSRISEEREIVRTILSSVIGIDAEVLYDESVYSFDGVRQHKPSQECLDFSLRKLGVSREDLSLALKLEGIVPTSHMRRMLTLLIHSTANSEPSLLVGATGGGKTSCCSVVCKALKLKLLTVNCHRHIEACDILGSFRPVQSVVEGGPLFEWIDGPLVRAMKQGHAVLIDEINMAEDAVIERLNSVLEIERTLLLSEKGPGSTRSDTKGPRSADIVQSAPDFRIMATMNPGGDFGKRELSPALRNRFTEIWVPATNAMDEFIPIVRSVLCGESIHLRTVMKSAEDAICSFLAWVCNHFNDEVGAVDSKLERTRSITIESRFLLSARDISTWCIFIKEAIEKCGMDPILAFVHGACLVFLDGLSVGSSKTCDKTLEEELWDGLIACVPESLRQDAWKASFRETSKGSSAENDISVNIGKLEFGGFKVLRGTASASLQNSSYSFSAPCTVRNTARLARAMIVGARPILLEGPPGCGKSSLVTALARKAGFGFLRINLSESTEMSDLVGMDTPGKAAGTFAFRKGPLLTALEQGTWVLLDELNLASQSVLEGLNSVLDHRRSIYVPELGKEIAAHPSFKIFGAQNSVLDGGGRRGLPKSFLNRFTKVEIESATTMDIVCIIKALHPTIGEITTNRVVEALQGVRRDLTNAGHSFDQASFGLRDALRWCDLLGGVCEGIDNSVGKQTNEENFGPFFLGHFFDIVVLQGLKEEARKIAESSFRKIFNHEWKFASGVPSLKSLDDGRCRIGGSVLAPTACNFLEYESLSSSDRSFVPERFQELQALSVAVNAAWPVVLTADDVTCEEEGIGLVRTLATLCGKRLNFFHGAALADFDEFVGGYVQEDVAWLMRKISAVSKKVLQACLHSSVYAECTTTNESVITSLEESESCQKKLDIILHELISQGNAVTSNLDQFVDTAETFAHLVRSVASERSNTASHLSILEEFLSRLHEVRLSSENVPASSFVWVKSDFVRAIENGDWIVLMYADMCPPAVLDRLNPLLERPPIAVQGGSSLSPFRKLSPVVLAEAPPKEDGSPVLMTPHSDFRIFFICRKARGGQGYHGLSRALLDRSLRLFVPARRKILGTDRALIKTDFVGDTCNFRYEIGSSHQADNVGTRNSPLLQPETAGSLRLLLSTHHLRHCLDENVKHIQEPAIEIQIAFQCIPKPFTRVVDFTLNPVELIIERESVALQLAETMPIEQLAICFHPSSELLLELTEFSNNTNVNLSRQSVHVRALLVQAVAERFLLSSSCAKELSRRSEILKARSLSTNLRHISDVYQRIHRAAKMINCQLSAELGTRGSITKALGRQLPLDAIYAGDRTIVFHLQRISEQLHAAAAHRAKQCRLELNSLFLFRESWDRATRASTGAANENTILAVGKLAHEVGDHHMNISGAPVQAMVYRVLLAISAIADNVMSLVDDSSRWEFTEEDVLVSLLVSGSELCDLATCTVAADVSEIQSRVVEVVNLLSTLYTRTRVSHILPDGFLDSIAGLSALSSRWKEGKSHMIIVNMPKSKPSQEAEAEILAGDSLRRAGLLDLKEVEGLVQALATLCSETVQQADDVLDVLRKVGATLNRLRKPEHFVWSGLEYWLQGSFTHVIGMLEETLILLQRKVSSTDDLSDVNVVMKPLSECLLQLKCHPRANLGTLVGLQCCYWLLAVCTKENAHKRSALPVKEIQAIIVAELLAEKANSLFQDVIDDAQLKDGISGNPTSVWEALHVFSRDPSESVFWNLDSARQQAIAATMLFAMGEHVSNPFMKASKSLLARSLTTALQSRGQFLSDSNCDALSLEEQRFLNWQIELARNAVNSAQPKSEKWEYDTLQLKALIKFSQTLSQCDTGSEETRPYSSARTTAEAMYTFGEAWVSLALLRLRAFHIEMEEWKGVDPSDVALSLASITSERGLRASMNIAAHILHGHCRLGGESADESDYVNRMKAEHLHATTLRQTVKARIVFRPKDRLSFSSFITTLTGVDAVITRKVLRSDLIARLSPFPRSSSDAARAHFEASDLYQLCATTAETLGLSGSLSHFRDLSTGLLLGLRELQYGLACCVKASKLSLVLEENDSISQLVFDLTEFPKAAFVQSLSMDALLRGCVSENIEPDALLACVEYAVDSCTSGFRTDLENISVAFRALVGIWKAATLKVEEENRQRSSLHVLREVAKKEELSGNDAIEILETNVDHDFEVTFNPIGEELEHAMLGVYQDYDDEPKQVRVEKNDSKHVPRGFTLNVNVVWKLYESVFSAMHDNSTSYPSRQPRALILQNLSTHLFSLSKEASIVDHIPIVWSFFLSLEITRGFGQNRTELGQQRNRESMSFNFYKDRHPAELLNASNALQRLHAVATQIQKQQFADSGGHPVLEEVTIAIKRIAKNSHLHSPLSIVVLGLESVLRKVDEWRKLFATSANRMDDEVLELSKVVARWRGMERDSWTFLLQSRIDSYADRANKWFFFLFDALMNEATTPMLVESADALNSATSAIDQFLRSSPTGEFLRRLEMIQALSNHALLSSTEVDETYSSLGHSLRGIVRYYSLYANAVSNEISNSKKAVHSKLNEFSRLQSWNLGNDLGASQKMSKETQKHLEYYRLKTAAERTRRKLHKLCLEVDSFLRLPVFNHVTKEINKIGFSTLTEDERNIGFRVEKTLDGQSADRIGTAVKELVCKLRAPDAYDKTEMQANLHVNESSLLSRLPLFERRMRDFGQKLRVSKDAPCDHANSFTERARLTIHLRAEHLRNSGADVQPKKRAFVELMKTLLRVGLSPFEGKFSRKSNDPSLWIKSPDPSQVHAYNSVANDLFYVAAQRVRRLREVSDSRLRNSDITGDEAQKSRAFCRHLFEQACSQRESISYLTADITTILERVFELQSLKYDVHVIQSSPRYTKSTVQYTAIVLNRLKKVCEDFRATAESIMGASESLTSTTLIRSMALPDFLSSRQLLVRKDATLKVGQVLFELENAIRSVLALPETSRLVHQFAKNNSIMDTCATNSCKEVKKHLALLLARLEDGLTAVKSISSHNIGVSVLHPVVSFLRVSIENIRAQPTLREKSRNSSFTVLLGKVETSCETLVERTVLGAQNVLMWKTVRNEEDHSHGEDAPSEREGDNVDPFRQNVMVNAHTYAVSLHSRANLDQIVEVIEQIKTGVCELFEDHSIITGAERKILKVLTTIHDTMRLVDSFVTNLILPCIEKVCRFHCHSLTLLKTLTSVIIGLCLEGYCRPDNVTNDEKDEEFVTDKSGTGFGNSGDGDVSTAQDISDQIEDEEQLLGLRGDNEEQVDESGGGPDSKDGFEMSSDFTGKLDDVEGMEDLNEDEEFEKKLADENGRGNDTIDEKLWNDNNNLEDEDTKDPGGSTSAPPNDSKLADLVAKEDLARSKKEHLTLETAQSGEQEIENDAENDANGNKSDHETEKDERKEQDDTERENLSSDTKRGLESGKRGTTKVEDTEDSSRNERNAERDRGSNEMSSTDDDKEKEHYSEKDGEAENNGRDTSQNADEEPNDISMTGIGEQNAEELQLGENVENVDREKADEAIPDDLFLDNNDNDIWSDSCKPEEEHELSLNDGLPNAEKAEENISIDNGDPDTQELFSDDEYLNKDPSLENTSIGESSPNSKTNANFPLRSTLDSGKVTTNQDLSVDTGGDATCTFPVGSKGNEIVSGEGKKGNDDDGLGADGRGRNDLGQINLDARQESNNQPETDKVDKTCVPNANPHRATATDEIVKEWSRFLEMVQESNEYTPENSGSDTRDLHDGAWQFEKDNDIKLGEKHALGAATEEQHHPMPENTGEKYEPVEQRASESKLGESKENAQEPGTAKTNQGTLSDVRHRNQRPDNDRENSCADTVEASPERKPHPARIAAEVREEQGGVTAASEVKSDGHRLEREESVFDAASPTNDKATEDNDAKSLTCGTENLSDSDAAALWRKLDTLTLSGASALCEQLRLVLEPTVATGLAGGYRTGKRLNIRKVIEFVASDFRKDRIWLRRVKPDKRSYDVLLAIDDSESMSESGAGPMAIESLALITSALSKLEIGRLAVASFGIEPVMVRWFDEPLPLSDEKGGYLLQQFRFSQKETDVSKLLQFIRCELGDINSMEGTDNIKLAFIISDGRLSGRDEIKKHLRRLKELNVLVALIIVDKVGSTESSIYDVKRVQYSQNGKISIVPYMQDFPINYYAVVHQVEQLPIILADALRQWVELTSNQL